jgi:hypothetical protein
MVRSAMNAGHIEDPMTLEEALTSGRIMPGQTVYLRGGTYQLAAALTWTLSGTAELPIIVRPYQNEVVVIDIGAHDFYITGSFCNIYDLRVFSSNASGRVSVEYSTDPTDIYLGEFAVQGTVNLYGCVIHDVRNFSWSHLAAGGTLADCIIYNVGWQGPDNNHWGHALYTQNTSAAGEKRLRQCLFAQSYGQLGVRGSAAAGLYRYRLSEVVGLHLQLWFGGYDTDHHDCAIADGVFLRAAPRLERGNAAGAMAWTESFLDLADNFRITDMQGFVFTGNTIVANTPTMLITVPDGGSVGMMDDNAYYKNDQRRMNGVLQESLAAWQQATGLETTSTYSASYPAARQWAFSCTHSLQKIGMLAFADYTEPAAVTFDVTALGLVQGATYRLRSGYDYLGDVSEFVYDGSGSLEISLTGRTAAIPHGAEAALVTVHPTVGAWVIEHTS